MNVHANIPTTKATDTQLNSMVSTYCDMIEKRYGKANEPEIRQHLFRATLDHVKLLNDAYGALYAERSLKNK